jgi:type 2 lantibiotic biosynthesis protein LanM
MTQFVNRTDSVKVGSANDLDCEDQPPVYRGVYPFEDIWTPVAKEVIDKISEKFSPLLTPESIADCRRLFLSKISRQTFPTLYEYFRKISPIEEDLIPSAQETNQYREFIQLVHGAGWEQLCSEYPLLPNLIEQTTQFFVENFMEMFCRLIGDWGKLTQAKLVDQEAGKITSIQGGLSDPHHGQKEVIVLTFMSGEKICYKPRSLGLESAWAKLIKWVNASVPGIYLRAMQVIDRGEYGWAEYIKNEPQVRDDEDFWYDVGCSTFWLYLLGFTDGHVGNFVINNGNWVLVDGETLLHPILVGQDDTLLRSGLLPRWEQSPLGEVVDISGLGGQPYSEITKQILDINTDAMRLGGGVSTSLEKLPINTRLSSVVLKHLLIGFQDEYRFATQSKKFLLGDQSPLAAFKDQIGRVIVKPTQDYIGLLNLRIAGGLMNQSQLEKEVCSMSPSESESEKLVSLSEVWQLRRGDVPVFQFNTSTVALNSDSGNYSEFFRETPFEQLNRRVMRLGAADLAVQKRLISQSFQTKAERYPAPRQILLETFDPTRYQPSALENTCLCESYRLADLLVSQVIQVSKSQFNWLHLRPVKSHWQLGWMDSNLYSGWQGVVLFLASLDGLAKTVKYSHIVETCLDFYLKELIHRKPLSVTQSRLSLTGLAGEIYFLTKLGHIQNRIDLFDIAGQMVEQIPVGNISDADDSDVMSGIAGLLLAILKLVDNLAPSRQALTLEFAQLCGRSLVSSQSINHSWWAPGNKGQQVEMGLAHNSIGICLSLAKLYERTQEPELLNTCRLALWGSPDPRPLCIPTSANQPSWCNRLPSIGLACLGLHRILEVEELAKDVRFAVEKTLGGGSEVDLLCCGTFGHTDLILTAGLYWEQDAWIQAAQEIAVKRVLAAQNRGGYLLEHGQEGLNPSLFRGIAGIGYQLARLVYPDYLDSVLLWE